MEKIHGNMHVFCAYSLKIYMKAQKHACFHVFSLFSAHLFPPLHHNGKWSNTNYGVQIHVGATNKSLFSPG